MPSHYKQPELTAMQRKKILELSNIVSPSVRQRRGPRQRVGAGIGCMCGRGFPLFALLNDTFGSA